MKSERWKGPFYIFGEILIFTFLIFMILYMFMGDELRDPITKSNPSAQQGGDSYATLSKKYESVQQKVQEQDKLIQDLQTSLREKQMQLDAKENDASKQQSTTNADNYYKKTAATYGNMSPSNAASILENLTVQDAASILKYMNVSQQADILGRMDPKKAAIVSNALKELAKKG